MARAMTYKLVIFDFDGTLADSFSWFVHNVNRAADRFRFKHIDPDNTQTLRNLGVREIMRRVELSPWKLPFIARFMRQAMAADVSSIALFDGVAETFQQLSKQGSRIALVTSNSRENVLHILGNENASHLEFWECNVAAFGKTRRLKKLVRASGLQKREVLYVGDETRDAEAAHAAGIAFAGAGWGYSSQEALAAVSGNPPLKQLSGVLDLLARSR